MMSQSITVSDTELLAYHELKSAIAQFNEAPSELDMEQKQVVSQTAQRSYELENLVLSSPEAQDIVIPPHSIAKSMDEIEKRYEDSDAFLKALVANGLTVEALQGALRREHWVEVVMERVTSEAPEITEEQVETFYKANIDKFSIPEIRTLRHILVTVNEENPENSRTEVEKRLKKIQRELAKGKGFDKLANRYSECPTALNGGELGEMPRGKLFPEIDEVAFSLNEGATGGPVETEVGYHIVKCDAIRPAHEIAFEDAKLKIIQYLEEKQKTIIQRKWLRSLGAQ